MKSNLQQEKDKEDKKKSAKQSKENQKVHKYIPTSSFPIGQHFLGVGPVLELVNMLSDTPLEKLIFPLWLVSDHFG